jgi:hypothetical protein
MPAKRKTPPPPAAPPQDSKAKPIRDSAFNEIGFQATIDPLCEEVRELYQA